MQVVLILIIKIGIMGGGGGSGWHCINTSELNSR
jgi:hypothetical protein